MNVVVDLNVDVRIIFGRQIDIVRYHPTIVQFNAMNQSYVFPSYDIRHFAF
jgi:hypothetical protein